MRDCQFPVSQSTSEEALTKQDFILTSGHSTTSRRPTFPWDWHVMLLDLVSET